MGVEGRVEAHGLEELRGALRQVDLELPKQLRVAFKPIAEHVVGVIRSRMPHRSGEAAGQVRARATQTGAGIAFPGGGVPWHGVKGDYFPWLDFGGSVGARHREGVPWSGSTVRDWRGRPGGSGRYVYPAIAEESPNIADAAGKAVDEVARRAGLEVRG